MGLSISNIFNNLWKDKEARLLILGLDGAGKSSIMHKMKFGENISTAPTIGFNVDEIKVGKLSFNVWDIGGQDKLRSLWRHYYPGTDGIIFVVDSADPKRFELAKAELHKLLEDEDLREVPVIVFANKQDL